MLERAHKLCQAINLFVSSADDLYGPITTIRRDGRLVKHIAWAAFKLTEGDWIRVMDARDILMDSNKIQQEFSAEKVPTLWRALPALEELQTAWEKKRENPRYQLYHDALSDGLDKIGKYYCRTDEKKSILISLAIHPYYKLAYIEMSWGGEEEQASERAKGNLNAKNWKDEARKILEHTMAEYWKTRPRAPTHNAESEGSENQTRLSEYDRHRQTLITQDEDEGWNAELRRYLKDMPADVTRDTDLVEWWQNKCTDYPTLSRIALDILPCQASSVPCERLFSASKQIAVDRRARLGAKVFEELQIMKFAWRNNLPDLAAWNSGQSEELLMDDYMEMLAADEQEDSWSNDGELL